MSHFAEQHTTHLDQPVNGRLVNKIVLVTGASRGIGEAIVRLFVQEGAKVVLASRNQEEMIRIVRWTLENDLGLVGRDPEPMPFDAARALEIAGNYENAMMTFSIDTVGASLRLEIRIKPEIRAAAEQKPPPDPSRCDFGLLPGNKDEYIITNGGFQEATRFLHPRHQWRGHRGRPRWPVIQAGSNRL